MTLSRRLASPRTALVVGMIEVVLLAAFVPILALAHQLSLGSIGAPCAIFISFGAVGFVIARRHPANPIGWLMLAGIGGGILGSDAGYYAWAAYGVHHGLPLDWLALTIGETWGTGTVVVALPLVILLLPDGAPPSRAWRRVIVGLLGLVAVAVGCELGLAASALAGHHLNASTVNNGPGGGLIQSEPPDVRWLTIAPIVSDAAAVALIAAAVARQLIAHRRAVGVRRQQLKCLMCGMGVCVLSLCVLASGTANGGDTLPEQIWSQVPWVALSALPISIGLAIFRHRMYDIDRVISRTLAYALLTALLAGTFIGLVALTTDALALSGRVGVAASTLVAAALFNPLRIRTQRLVDRHFNRARYDADAIVAAFTTRLRDAVEIEAIRSDLLDTVERAVQPAHASVWLRL